MGANPIYYLVVPRFLGCLVLIPILTLMADFMGVMGAAFICTRFYTVEPHFYWEHSQHFISIWDVFNGLVKSIFFGIIIALIRCHRGLISRRAGAEGVGQAATEAFVISFLVILIMDFFLGMLLLSLHRAWWGDAINTFV
jgi:phospholipid/cholesterol/gamma-HCH transport system permease protein